MATASGIAGKVSFLEKLTRTIYLDYVLKVLGIILLVLAIFTAWHQIGFGTKFLLISGPIAWYVGARFDKIYR